MRATADPLFARAAEALRSAQDVREQTRDILDTARLERLERELAEKMMQIERMVSLSRSVGVSPAGARASRPRSRLRPTVANLAGTAARRR